MNMFNNKNITQYLKCLIFYYFIHMFCYKRHQNIKKVSDSS